MSKLIKDAILDQLNKDTGSNNLVPSTVCAYRKNCSTKLALLRITNDIKMPRDKQNLTALIAIDLLVPFNTMNHQILIIILDKFYDIYLENGSIRVQIYKSLQIV